MSKFGVKGHISNEIFMMHILINLPEAYRLILDGLENILISTGPNMLTIEMIHKKLITGMKKK